MSTFLQIIDTGSPMPIQEHRSFTCEFSDCSAVSRRFNINNFGINDISNNAGLGFA